MSKFIYCYAERRYVDCRYAECHYTECRGAVTKMCVPLKHLQPSLTKAYPSGVLYVLKFNEWAYNLLPFTMARYKTVRDKTL